MGPPRRSALVTTSPYQTVETGFLRKRCGRQLCPAPLAGSTVTIGLPPARRILGASPAAYAFARPIKNSWSQGGVPLSAGSPFESCFRTSTLPWECFDSRTYSCHAQTWASVRLHALPRRLPSGTIFLADTLGPKPSECRISTPTESGLKPV